MSKLTKFIHLLKREAPFADTPTLFLPIFPKMPSLIAIKQSTVFVSLFQLQLI